MRFLVCISASIGGIFLKVCILHSVRMGYKFWGLVPLGYWQFTWKTKYVFGCISASMGAICLKTHHPSHFPGMRYKHFKFRCSPSLIKGILLEENVPPPLCLCFRSGEFPESLCLALPTHAIHSAHVWLWSVNTWEHFTWETKWSFRSLDEFSWKSIFRPSRACATNDVVLLRSVTN